MPDPVTVIGAGNGGIAIAAYLSSIGVKVRLCDLFMENLKGIQKEGGIILTHDGMTSKYSLELVTSDLSEAISGVKLIMVVTPAFTHRIIAEACSGILSDGQIIMLNPGRTGGAVEFVNTIRAKDCRADVTVAEAQTLVYTCRKTGPASVEIYAVKKELTLGAIPSERTQMVLDAVRPYYPQFTPAKNCLETSLANIGALLHPAPILLNVGRIETDPNDFLYYWDAISPSVAVLIADIDKERLAVADAYSVEAFTAEEWLKFSYETHGDSIYELIQNNKLYGNIKTPSTIENRYITEDVPMSLVPISELGRIANVPTPNIDAVIQLTSTICGQDFRKNGRCAKNLGLEGMSKEQVVNFFETGVP